MYVCMYVCMYACMYEFPDDNKLEQLLEGKPLEFTDTLYAVLIPCAAIDFKNSSNKKTDIIISFCKHSKDSARMIT